MMYWCMCKLLVIVLSMPMFRNLITITSFPARFYFLFPIDFQIALLQTSSVEMVFAWITTNDVMGSMTVEIIQMKYSAVRYNCSLHAKAPSCQYSVLNIQRSQETRPKVNCHTRTGWPYWNRGGGGGGGGGVRITATYNHS